MRFLRPSRLPQSPLHLYQFHLHLHLRLSRLSSTSTMDHPKHPTGDADTKRPKKLIFAPGDIATPDNDNKPSPPSTPDVPPSAATRLVAESLRSETSTPNSVQEKQIVSHPARAHQFVSNPPLTVSQMHPTNPLHQFNTWFRDSRLPASSAPETCTLATASLPEGRVSARIVYLKELDERGWVVYSNWGSREGKGGQVFGTTNEADGADGDVLRAMPEPSPELNLQEELQLDQVGNKWAALTFCWSTLERQVRIEGLVEPLSRSESELYWRTRERGSQIGAWASWQSKVLWETEPHLLIDRRRKSLAADEVTGVVPAIPGDVNETDIDDGRALLERRVQEMEKRFADTKEIPLPPFWGGVRIVPESVEFWQGRRSRLHDRFRYVRVHENGAGGREKETYRWRIQRLSP
ncbi:pyridoxamine-phosphate oxidase PDX3 [Aspergillus melleus]|uniref:pyridoxamine-phosphate oxidase PDX3 n=1 Tax=Aspergillus melleus TaxID=138277 RepID=UPI001E8D94B7|nr:pyridoxamine-phosphate oxidase [Aspergillus melleus]KAH8434047.1 pyridoxamine-phosphate oxidase [Aspergillus melleus]